MTANSQIKTPRLALHPLTRFTPFIAFPSINLLLISLLSVLLTYGNAFAATNTAPYAVQDYEANATIKSFNETSVLAQRIWANLTNHFVVLYEQGDYESAHKVAQRAFDIALNNFGLNDVNTADALLKLGIINQTIGKLSVAEDHLLGSLVILEEQLSPDHPDVAVTSTNLGNVYFEMGRMRESEKYHNAALRIRRNAFGDSNPTVAQSTYNLAILYEHEGNYLKAEIFYNQAIQLWSNSVGAAHPYVGSALNNLTNVYAAQEKYQDAASTLERTVLYKKTVFGVQHEEVAQTLISLGTAFLEQGKYDSAGAAYAEALDIAQHILASSDPQLALLMYTLANIYHMQARMVANDHPVPHSQNISDNADDTKNAKIAETNLVSNNINGFENTTLLAQALPLYKKAAEILDTDQKTNWTTLSVVLSELAMLYKAIGDTDMAIATESRLSTH